MSSAQLSRLDDLFPNRRREATSFAVGGLYRRPSKEPLRVGLGEREHVEAAVETQQHIVWIVEIVELSGTGIHPKFSRAVISRWLSLFLGQCLELQVLLDNDGIVLIGEFRVICGFQNVL